MRDPLTTINIKFNKALLNEPYDIIIIGSGISGFCCAALLALKEKKVLVLEKHFKIGGYAHAFKRKGYEWDVGIHYVGDMHKEYNPARKIFDLITGGNLHWAKMHDNCDNKNLLTIANKNYVN